MVLNILRLKIFWPKMASLMYQLRPILRNVMVTLSVDTGRHIVETGLTLLHHASIPLTFWPEAFATAVYLINRLPKENSWSYFFLSKAFSKTTKFICIWVFVLSMVKTIYFS